MPSQLLQGFRLGPWLVEPLRGAITDPNGTDHHLEPKVMDVFVCLAEHANEMVTRDTLLEVVWGERAVSDEPLTRAIGELRRTFRNGRGNSMHIETVPKRGYRLVGKVRLPQSKTDKSANTIPFPERHRIAAASSGLVTEDANPASTATKYGGRKTGIAIVGALSLTLIMLMVYESRQGQSLPQTATFYKPVVTAYKKLTQSQIIPLPGSSVFPIVADDSRLYFPVYADGDYEIKQVSQAGGQVAEFSYPYGDSTWQALPSSLTPDGSSIVFDVVDIDVSGTFTSEMWTLPVVGGSSIRLGEGRAGIFDPSGEQLLFIKDHRALYLANADMTEERKIASVPGMTIYWPRFSPDGSRVRFTVFSDHYAGRQWELKLDGGSPEPLLEHWPAKSTCCGSWTPDGEYFVFEARHEDGTSLWAVKNSADGTVGSAEPFPITSGVVQYSRPTISADGETIFAYGWQLRGEVVEYDAEAFAFKPIPGLEMMSIERLAYSSDKRWLAYVSYPDFTLWRKKLDGSSTVQLTFGSMRVSDPVWSPDGSLIAFVGWEPGEIRKIYAVPADGGVLTPISDAATSGWSPSWSADGSRLAFSQGRSERLKVFDFALGETVELPGTEGMHSPKWSPDGHFIACAIGQDLGLYDVENESWEFLLEVARFDSISWSANSKSIYLVESFHLLRERSVYRLDIDDRSLEKIARVGQERSVWGAKGPWVGVTPDGTPMLLRDHSIHNIYALEWNRD